MESVERRVAAPGFNNNEVMPNLVSTVSLFTFHSSSRAILCYLFSSLDCFVTNVIHYNILFVAF